MESASQGKPSRKGERTRRRLLEATLALIEREGLAALTTTRVAREAGVAQPTFYQYFRGLDACLEQAGRFVAASIRPSRPELVARARGQLQARQDLPAVIQLLVEEMTRDYLAQPELTKLYQRYQQDPSPFGRAMDGMVEREREELLSIFWDGARRLGAKPEHYPVVALQAQLVVGMAQAAIRAVMYDEFRDRDMVLWQLRVMIQGALEKNLELLGVADGG